ncbi:hypothetical protein [Oceanicoccus sp. KOV_DT_Chl]|uniref:hypothetical protein n=1 Tax=Oceanicoccus sp. KOV_DT_Chl TaxID=1904639 RepID=UPI000C7C7B5F|nr:hypothetical protein [Oceanicoccus sp. KOV_DT_Chl]
MISDSKQAMQELEVELAALIGQKNLNTIKSGLTTLAIALCDQQDEELTLLAKKLSQQLGPDKALALGKLLISNND